MGKFNKPDGLSETPVAASKGNTFGADSQYSTTACEWQARYHQ